MDKVDLSKDGAIAHQGKTVADDPLMYLGFGITLEDGYTLRSYFRMIERYAPLAKLNAFFPAYFEQYLACPESGCRDGSLELLELDKTVEMIGFPKEPRLEIYTSLKGRRGDESPEIRSLPLESLLDMPIKLGQLKHILLGDKVDMFAFETVFSLFEFIDAIAWELSFHGTSVQCAIRR
jgi:hypothetical protein